MDKFLKGPKIEPVVFWCSLCALIIASALAAIYQDNVLASANKIMGVYTGKWGWSFMIFGAAAIIFLLWLGFSPYGKIKLGKPDDKPDFSTPAWMAMLFCTGIGTGLIYWSIIEPIYYMQGPPFGLEVGSTMAAEWAAAYGIYHWGPIPWAIMLVFGVPLAYYYYVRKNERLSIGGAFKGKFGKYDGWVANVIDLLVMFAVLGEATTILGLGTPMLSASIARLLGIPESFSLTVLILIIWTGIFCTSTFLGLDRGLKKLSNINVYLAVSLLIFTLFAGPTSFIFNTFTNSLGLIFQNAIRMTLWTDPVGQGGWPQGWTIFFFAWWLGAAPFVGVFLAKISKGRTIREVAIAPLVWGSLGCAVFFAVFGGISLHTELYGASSMTELMAQTSPATTIAAILSQLPVSLVVFPLFIVLMFVFCATTIDSCSYSLAIVCTKALKQDEEPARWNRMFWAVGIGISAVTLMAIGGLKPLQALSLITAAPLMFIAIGLAWFFVKDMQKDTQTLIQRDTIGIDYDPASGTVKNYNSTSISSGKSV